MLSTRLNCVLERSLPFRPAVWRLVPRLLRLFGNRPRPLIPFAAVVVLVPSKAGMPEDPHWFENATADPEVTFGGRGFRAEAVEDEGEQARLWALGDAYYPPYASYRSHAARFGRRIPILRLVPVAP